MRTASASRMRALSSRTSAGAGSSSSSLKAGMSCRPSHNSSSHPDGSFSAAARSRRVLWDSARRLPLRPRTFIVLGADQRELDVELDVLGEDVPAGRQRRVPVEAEVVAVEVRLEVEGAALVAVGILDAGGPGAGRGDLAGVALDRQLAADGGRAVVLELEVVRAERDDGMVLDVEEVGRQDVLAELLGLADRDRLDLRLALEHEAAVGRRQLGRRVLKRAAERRRAHV